MGLSLTVKIASKLIFATHRCCSAGSRRGRRRGCRCGGGFSDRRGGSGSGGGSRCGFAARRGWLFFWRGFLVRWLAPFGLALAAVPRARHSGIFLASLVPQGFAFLWLAGGLFGCLAGGLACGLFGCLGGCFAFATFARAFELRL